MNRVSEKILKKFCFIYFLFGEETFYHHSPDVMHGNRSGPVVIQYMLVTPGSHTSHSVVQVCDNVRISGSGALQNLLYNHVFKELVALHMKRRA